jgi:hypothetical protein
MYGCEANHEKVKGKKQMPPRRSVTTIQKPREQFNLNVPLSCRETCIVNETTFDLPHALEYVYKYVRVHLNAKLRLSSMRRNQNRKFHFLVN